MRSVRMRLLASHLILVLLLGIVMSAAISSFVSLQNSIDRVLEGNYKSISAAQRMKNGLMLDLAGYGELLIGERQVALDRFKNGETVFKQGLIEANQSVNESGEENLLTMIAAEHQAHRRVVDFVTLPNSLGPEEKAKFSLDESVHYDALNRHLEELIEINQDAMTRESERAKNLVQQSAQRSILIAGSALILAIFLTVGLSRSLLKPLRQLAEQAEVIGKGDYPEPLNLHRNDELGALAKAFNLMSGRLNETRQLDQQRLMRAEKMSDQALQALYDPVIITDADGLIVYLNRAAEGLFGPSPATPRSPIISHIGDQIIMDAIYGAIQQDVAQAAEDETSQVPILVGDSQRTYRLRATPMKDDDGEMLGSVAVLEDITHLKEIDRLKSEFIGVASHELRTPVASLMMSVQLLEEGAVGELTESQKKVVAVQKQDLERLQRLMKELLDLSRLEAGTQPMRYSLVDPLELINGAVSACRPQASEKGVKLDVEIDPDLQHVRADRSHIERVLINLIVNAVRHTPAKGLVKVRATKQSNQVTFSIEDNGEGMPPEFLSKIFDRFVQVPGATGGGAGLGLSIAHNIVKAHGGNIWVESKLREGSAFYFTLPTDPDAVGEPTF